MGDALQTVLNQALALPALDRVRVIETLQDSLDARHTEIEQAWLPELERRAQAIREGASVPKVPEVLRQYREKKHAAPLG
jgi:putative addiction module component (TIGR02574 family)